MQFITKLNEKACHTSQNCLVYIYNVYIYIINKLFDVIKKVFRPVETCIFTIYFKVSIYTD